MPRKSKTAVEEGYLRSLWEEVAELEREYNAVVTITIYATTSRGVFTVEMGALQMGVIQDNEPLRHSITKRLPDGGTLPFAGALWYCAHRLSNMVCEATLVRLRDATRKG